MQRLVKQLLLVAFLTTTVVATAQNVGINATGASPHASALLDVAATNKGVLIPRMTQAQRDAITSPATGLLIYQTNGTAGFYYYTGSTWTGIGGNDTDWSESGNYVFNTTDSVGIGTNSPAHVLSVSGNSSVSGVQYAGAFYSGDQYGQAKIEMYSAFSTDTALVVKTSNAKPSAYLWKHPATGGVALEASSGSGVAGYFTANNGGTGVNGVGGIGVEGEGNTYGGQFIAGAVGALAVNAYSIQSSGDVAHFSIGNASNTGNALHGIQQGQGKAGVFTISNTSNGDTALYAHTNGTGHSGFFENTGTTNASAAMVAKTNGTGRAGQFQISNVANASDAIYATTNGTGNAANFSGRVLIDPPGALADFQFTNQGFEPAIFPTTNNYGVLGSNTQRLFDVHTTNLTVYGTFTNLSDRSMKKNVTPLQGGLQKVMALNGVTYDLSIDKVAPNITGEKKTKMEEDGEGQIGFIAQELEQVLPELVKTHEGTGLKTVNYQGVIPVLVEAIKEQQATIETLKKELEEIQRKVAE